MLTFEGHAIVSVDGMIADAAGEYPAVLLNDADWAQYQRALDVATIVVCGRRGHERHPNATRRRLVLTRSVRGLAPDPDSAAATYWNPADLTLEAALAELGITSGIVAIAGLFGLFIPTYTSFLLSESNRLVLPGGTPCFAHGHPRDILTHAGFRPGRVEVIDPVAMVTSTLWTRPLDSGRPTG